MIIWIKNSKKRIFDDVGYSSNQIICKKCGEKTSQYLNEILKLVKILFFHLTLEGVFLVIEKGINIFDIKYNEIILDNKPFENSEGLIG